LDKTLGHYQKARMVEQKYFKEGANVRLWMTKYTNYNKINNNSENFRGQD